MERRDAFFVLALLGGAGYAVYANWDTISDRLGLEKIDPSRLKAIDLAKDGIDLRSGTTNWQHLKTRRDCDEIRIADEPWQATPIGGNEFRVVVRWKEDDEPVAHSWRVDIAQRTSTYEGEFSDAAPPR